MYSPTIEGVYFVYVDPVASEIKGPRVCEVPSGFVIVIV